MGFDLKVTDRNQPLTGKPLVSHPRLGRQGLGRLVLGKSAEPVGHRDPQLRPVSFRTQCWKSTKASSDQPSLSPRR